MPSGRRKKREATGAFGEAKRKGIKPPARRFMLKAIGEYCTTDWIVAELKHRFGTEISPLTIDVNYRYNPQYRKQIQKYRESFNAGLIDEPLSSKRFMFQALRQAYEFAVDKRDAKALVSVVTQASKMMGYDAPDEVEHNHIIAGGSSFESLLSGLLEGQSSVIDVLPEQPGLLPSATVELDSSIKQTEP